MAVRLAGQEECRFSLDGESLRAGLAWATERQAALAETRAEEKCTPPAGCFITSACCEVLGLADNCFELRALRRYRDDVLAHEPGGARTIASYYALAPLILARLPREGRERLLLSIYARYVLPSAVAATLGLNGLAYRLYGRMLHNLTCAFAPEEMLGQWDRTV
jgi:hypothetical protein